MNRIAELRKEKGISQISLSLKLNLSQKMISAYETGKSEPSIATLNSDIRQPLDKILQTELNNDECILINKYRALPEKQKNISLGIILGLNSAT